MIKVLVVSGLGRHWDYSTYEVPDEMADEIEEMLEHGNDPKIIEGHIKKRSTRTGFDIPPRSKEAEEWYHLGTFDMLLLVEEFQ